MQELEGRRALVTGAGSDGIGRAVVQTLAAAGVRLAFSHLNQFDAAKALAAEIDAHPLNADLGDPSAARGLVRDAIGLLEGLDILVACAATLGRVPFLEISDEQFARVQQVNLHGTFAVAQEAARHMAEGGSGRIILISSVNQQHPTPNLAHYVASKGGVMMLARAMALELASTGVTVNLVAPGTILTDINRQAFADPAFEQAKLDLIPMKRVGQPADIAGAVRYLASDAAAYVTGSTITVDGGLTLP